LRRRLSGYIREVGPELGLLSPDESEEGRIARAGDGLEVAS